MDDDKKIEKSESIEVKIKPKEEEFGKETEKIEDIKSIEKKEVLERISEESVGQYKEGKKEIEKISPSQATDAGEKSLNFNEREKMIEKTLEGGLEDVYIKMNEEERRRFKKAGEEAANRINILLEQTKVKAKKIINLIKKWLLLIPGINKFFLEQEAKIKTDEIMKLKTQ